MAAPLLSRSKRCLVALAVAALVCLGLLRSARPALAAICPACFGFAPVRAGLYLERGTSVEERARIMGAIDEAGERVRRFYGARTESPRILVCVTPACYRRAGGGGERGKALGAQAVLLSPRGAETVIAAHELAHAELHGRVGAWALLRDGVPAWFDEGLAVVVSEDPRYLKPEGPAGDGCLVEPIGALPETGRVWSQAAGEGGSIYAMAACRVVRWVRAHGGPAAVVDLAARVAGGEPFASASR
jgi:hypothetical protein